MKHFIYSEAYYADIGDHVFPIIKYRAIYDVLTRPQDGIAAVPASRFVSPEAASDAQLSLVHTREYLDDLDQCRRTERTAYSELPITSEIIRMSKLVCGGTLLAARLASESGWAVHLSGGFHHAFADKAEGFCYLNDLAVAAKAVQQEKLAERVAILDCDLHQGNGTAHIFRDDPTVFTFSIHQRDLYPVKQESDQDIHLPVRVTDEIYLDHLRTAIPAILDAFRPELVLYQAGADPYENDQLGSLSLSIAGLQARDFFIYEACQQRGIPVATTLGGGYAYNTDDTVQIHVNTCRAAMKTFDEAAK